MRIVAKIDPTLSRYAARIARLADGQALAVISVGLSVGGEELRKSLVSTEAKQINLSTDTLNRALQSDMPTDTTFVIRARGGNIRLKYFSPVEGGGGVSASPRGKRTHYPGAFITSGRPGARRAVAKLNGQVYERIDKSRRAWGGKIRQVRSGAYIPDEMVKGATLAAFDRGAAKIGGQVLTRLAAALP
jgi:hypothetical protein